MPKAKESLRVPVVDGHHLIRYTSALILTDHGLETTVDYTGGEVVDAVSIRAFRFRDIGIVITDVVLGLVTATGLVSDLMRSKPLHFELRIR